MAKKLQAKLKQLEAKSKLEEDRQKELFKAILSKRQQKVEKTRKQIEDWSQNKLGAETERILQQSQLALKDSEKAINATIAKSMLKSLVAERKVIQSKTIALWRKKIFQRDKDQKRMIYLKALKEKSRKTVITLPDKVEKLEEQIKNNLTPKALKILEEQFSWGSKEALLRWQIHAHKNILSQCNK